MRRLHLNVVVADAVGRGSYFKRRPRKVRLIRNALAAIRFRPSELRLIRGQPAISMRDSRLNAVQCAPLHSRSVRLLTMAEGIIRP